MLEPLQPKRRKERYFKSQMRGHDLAPVTIFTEVKLRQPHNIVQDAPKFDVSVSFGYILLISSRNVSLGPRRVKELVR
jgi:hypothetical protein